MTTEPTAPQSETAGPVQANGQGQSQGHRRRRRRRKNKSNQHRARIGAIVRAHGVHHAKWGIVGCGGHSVIVS